MTSHQDLPDQCNCEICHARRIGDEPQLDDATMISWWENQVALLMAENERLRDAFRQVVTDRVVEAGAQSLCPDAWRKDSQGRYELDEPAREDMRAIAREVIAAALQAHSLIGDQGESR